jgi:hypothetical protein
VFVVSPPEPQEEQSISETALSTAEKIYVYFGVGTEVREGEVLGVSSSGLVIQSDAHYSPGTEVRMSFSATPGGESLVRMQATVVYCLSGRIALHFTNVRLGHHVRVLQQIGHIMEQQRRANSD